MANVFVLLGRTMEDVEVYKDDQDKDDQDDEDQYDINHTLLGSTMEDVEEEMVD